jgi:hypothetical protein
VRFTDPAGLCFGLGDCGPVDDALDEGGELVNDAYDEGKKVVKAAAPYALECAIWGGSAYVGTLFNPAAAGVGCATGVIARAVEELGVSNPFVECAIWGAGAFGVARVAATTAIAVAAAPRVGAAGCVSGATSWTLSELGLSNQVTQCGAWSIPVGIVTPAFWGRVSAMAGGCLGGFFEEIIDPKE